ncbi:thioredoxin domain-containing protein [Enterococcus dongliensis]|uniref:Thioredoxin domain-containing protein n=1 Tax=Enterococcus dongliensis TaxID=2559925 RepID=A0AAP5NB75_9ENTE|nr:thioredoxin domain-containing protein [Enterococcus dongliensis]MDT2595839.1 thioredoxin domain-containing protein [Enterococcus dongliensis]MDT2602900.1 thioredoxin domain-containing protein [Enterococcus dongliensis]MDT2633906.1 thioredoxin domain-containing protein [Enterococcus dongliensis]MDT2638223.1 thioredoxin domain-containing protein [Enterococcus dongliensis]MDT2639672.1 thioredoxin domain-containing protein [Enterococcus dongliensis]
MDISIIKAEFVNDFNGIKIGSNTAPKRLIEFLNLRCPYCKQWFVESSDTLNQAVAEGKIQRVIKLLDKDKISLQRGNIMHEYISSDPKKALFQIQQAFETQEIWGDFELEAVAAYAEKNLHLTQQANQNLQQEIRNEAEQANINFVPTIILGEHIFDEAIDETTLHSYIAE